MTVSVIVPTFNRVHYIGECLESLLAQTIPPIEIIVIDDGSEDVTANLLAHYGDRIRYVRKENGGKPSAVNLGLSLAQGDLIWIFDDDDVALPDAIERRLAVLAEKPGAGFVYSAHYVGRSGPDGRIVQGDLYTPPSPCDEDFFLEIMRSCFFSLNSALVRRDCYRKVNGLDPSLFSGEDYDFLIRLARVAVPAYCQQPTFIVRQHTGARGPAQMRYTEAERSEVFRRYSYAIGQKIRHNVQLGEYLTPPAVGSIDDQHKNRALVNRMHVMANHGCVAEFVEDLTSLLLLKSTKQDSARVNLDEIRDAFTRGWACESACADWPTFIESLRRLKSLGSGNACIRVLGQSIFRIAKGHKGSTTGRLLKAYYAARLWILAL